MTRQPVGDHVADRLSAVLRRADESGTSQLHGRRGDQTLASLGVDRVLPTASVTKLVVGVALGRAGGQGRLRLDDPVGRWVPSWSTDDRGQITIRHVLGHASGLDASTCRRSRPARSTTRPRLRR